MKKIAALALLLFAASSAWSATPTSTPTNTPTVTPTPAVTAPANVTVGPYNQDKTANLYWDEDTTVSNWQIFFGTALKYNIAREDTGVTGTARRYYRMPGIAQSLLPATITMKAIVPGLPVSYLSSPVVLAATSPNDATFILPAPGVAMLRFAMNPVTYASGVVGTSAQYLTLTSKSALIISNNSAGVMSFILSNSSTPPTDTNIVRIDIPANTMLNLNMMQGTLVAGWNWLHWYNPNTVTNTGQLTW